MALSWPYQFVNLSSEQVAERRKLLDRNGFYAWLSPIVVLVSLALYQGASRTVLLKTHIKSRRPTDAEIRNRRWKWWLSVPLTPEFGSRQVHLVGLVYAAWLLSLAVRQTSNDYMHVTKQIGHIAISQLPMHYLLAVKSPKSPVQLVTGLSYETLLPYHRLFGRIVHMFFLAHGILYMNFFKQLNLLPKRLASRDVQLGALALTMFNILAVTSIPPIRKAAYHTVFYRGHVALSMLVLPVLFFHVPYTRIYIIQCFLIGAFNAVSRKIATTPKIFAKVESAAEDTNLLRLTVLNPTTGGIKAWVPGQHCYLKQDLSPMLPRSPFTIVSLAQNQNNPNEIQLLLRACGGPLTSWLSNKSGENFEVMIEGPYGEAGEYVPDLLARENGDVLLVAGGVGATFTLPIYLSLLQEVVRRRDGDTPYPLVRERKITFVWVVKSQQESLWALQAMRDTNTSDIHSAHGLEVDVRIFVTNTARPSADPKTSHFLLPQQPQFDFDPTGNSVANQLSHQGQIPSIKLDSTQAVSTSTNITAQSLQESEALSLSTGLRTRGIGKSKRSGTGNNKTTDATTVTSALLPSPPITPFSNTSTDPLQSTSSSSNSDTDTAALSPIRSISPVTPLTEIETETETVPVSNTNTTPTAPSNSQILASLLSTLPSSINLSHSSRPSIPSIVSEFLPIPSPQKPNSLLLTTATTPQTTELFEEIPKLTVLACGPASLVEELRAEIGAYVMGTKTGGGGAGKEVAVAPVVVREVEFKSESFGHG